MPLYEHVFLARQDLAQAQVDALAETATKIIEETGGKDVMAEMFEKDVAGFTEERIEGAEPGEILPEPTEASEAPAEASEVPAEASEAETAEDETADQA